MAARPLASGADHADRVRQADIDTRSASVTKSNVMAFQSAFASLEQYFQDLFRVTDLDPNIRQSVNALLTEQKMRHMATGHLVDNFVSRFDQHMNLVQCPHPHSSGCLIQNVTATQLHQYPDGRRDEERL